LKKLDIVWSKETVAKLFEIGPAHYTPGTKMPEQTIGAEADRKGARGFSRPRDHQLELSTQSREQEFRN